ncbi:hypothetical protein LEP1GSC058_1973 [Leptospira fainei serovar Hurstbridge str. BUT 6]|uniref:Uncharacterized protein n=1 Tax=Leptospira fainei serovar Hurstbridge str. BUT 6 TaxID=1193011 RepID=S3V3P4_9LEPT|nr:hypothetical protein LEP1GSC058_1973 [Leptospira fainei serovar Hurstbridge str. BUT 6]
MKTEAKILRKEPTGLAGDVNLGITRDSKLREDIRFSSSNK